MIYWGFYRILLFASNLIKFHSTSEGQFVNCPYGPWIFKKVLLMGKFKIVKISDFLISREEKYKPDDDRLKGLKRLDKINFNGNIYLSEKSTKTDMIIVYPGDLVISGINVQKGAIAVYEGKEPITATIHYSSYMFDPTKIDIEYLKRFLKSSEFIKTLNEQVKGGIKTEIKAKTFLPIEIRLPSLSEQKKINKYFDSFDQELTELKSELKNQANIITQLKQSILQEAISGQLTAEWRSHHPIKKGDPNFDAKALLAKIKAEKEVLMAEGKLKKEKPLPEILPDDIPFDLPKSWVWCRLGKIIFDTEAGKSPKCLNESVNNKEWGVIKTTAVQDLSFLEAENKILPQDFNVNPIHIVRKNDLLITRAGPVNRVGIACCVKEITKNLILSDKTVRIKYVKNLINPQYLAISLNSKDIKKLLKSKMTGMADSQVNITQENIKATFIPLPPLAEQKIIVEKVDHIMKIIDQLEEQIKHRQKLAEDLMQTVLQEAFE